MLSPVPNGEQPARGAESEHGSGGGSHAEDSEGGSDDSESSDDAESSQSSERRYEHGSKRMHDPSVDLEKEAAPSAKTSKRARTSSPAPTENTDPEKEVAPSAKVPKRTRTASPLPTEKAAKQSKVTTSKPRKALPRIKVAVPVAST